MRKIYQLASVAVVAVGALSSCSKGEPSWTISGNVGDAEGKTLYVEAANDDLWYAIDSVKLDGNGEFKFSEAYESYPLIYRLRLDDKTVYFPVDTIVDIKFTSSGKAFDSAYTMSGDPAAEAMAAADLKVLAAAKGRNVTEVVSDSVLKRELASIAIGQRGSVAAYYIINKRISGYPLFDPAAKSDLRVIGAVANAFNDLRPDDPRASELKDLYLRGRVLTGQALASDTIHAEFIDHFDINLYDKTGNRKSLADISKSGKVILLNFTVYAADASPAFNMQLKSIYEKYRNSGLEIYQVSLDDNEATWRQSANNLPWVSVYNSQADGIKNMLNYNVVEIPASFIIDRHGEVVARIDGDDTSKIEAAIAKSIAKTP